MSLTLSPSSPVAGTTAIATAAGGTSDAKNRLVLNGSQIYTDCGDDAFTAGVTTSSIIATGQSLEWDQLIAGVWTNVDTLSFDTVAGPSSGSPHTVSTDNVTIEDELIQMTMPTVTSASSQAGISSSGGTAASPIDNLTIRRCTIRGGRLGIFLSFVNNLLIEDCLIEDADYAGIALFSCVHVVIQRNTIRRIGYVKNPATAFQGNNAYGIMTNRTESGSLVTDPVCEDVLIDSNVVDWVPLWMCINSHGGKDHTVTNNQTGHSPRGIFFAGSPTGAGTTQVVNAVIDDNLVLSSVTKSGGSTDQSGIKLLSATGTSVQGNRVGDSFTSDDWDTSGSTGVTVAGNTVVSG